VCSCSLDQNRASRRLKNIAKVVKGENVGGRIEGQAFPDFHFTSAELLHDAL